MASNPTLASTISVLVFYLASIAVAVPGTFNVLDYEAKIGGKIDNNKAFLATWEAACAYVGKAKYVVPAGSFLVGPIAFIGPCKGTIDFQVAGTVVAPVAINLFKNGIWISFESVKGLTLTGKGTFDGQGKSAWSINDRSGKVFPTSLQFSSMEDSVIEGITSLNAKMFHLKIYSSVNIKIRGITITAPEMSPNTDGIHLSLSKDIEITNSHIGTGDDCISIGPTNSDITVTKIFCGPGHGISVGSVGKYKDDKDVTNLLVKDCTMTKTMNGVRIKSWENSYALTCKNFTFQNITMNDVSNPIIIDQEYCPSGNCGGKTPSKVKIIDVNFIDIKGTTATPDAVNFKCSKLYPCKGVELDNVDIVYKEAKSSSTCSNVVKPNTVGEIMPTLACSG